MNGRIKKTRVGMSVEYSKMTGFDKLELLEKENKELQYEINDIRTSLAINKNAMVEVLTAASKDKQINALVVTINSLVKENMSLQKEVQRVQDEFVNSIRNSYSESIYDINENKIEDHKFNINGIGQNYISPKHNIHNNYSSSFNEDTKYEDTAKNIEPNDECKHWKWWGSKNGSIKRCDNIVDSSSHKGTYNILYLTFLIYII